MMRTFTVEEFNHYRETIKDFCESLSDNEGYIDCPTQPQARNDSWWSLSTWWKPKNTYDAVAQQYKHESLNEELDKNALAGDYNLSRFLRELYNIGGSINSRELKKINQLNDVAILFFLQAEANVDKSNQAEVNENCSAKLRLMMQGKITWTNIKEINDKHHPLLNPAAVVRMAEENGSTLAVEIEKVELRSAIKILLGNLLVAYLAIEFHRLAALNEINPVFSNANNKSSKFSTWLNDAHKLFNESLSRGTLTPTDRFDFFAYDAVIDVSTDRKNAKNLKELLKQKRNFADSSMPASYTRIIGELIPFLQHLKTIAEQDDQDVRMLRELKKGLELEYRESETQHPGFDATLKPLKMLIADIKPSVYWHEIQSQVDTYHSAKSSKRAIFFSGKTSAIVEKMKSILLTKDLQLAVSNKEKEILTVMMWQHVKKMTFNLKAKKISLSGVMIANLLRLLYSSESNNNELLALLKSFSSEQAVKNHVKQYIRSTLPKTLQSMQGEEEVSPPSSRGAKALSALRAASDTLESVGVELEVLKSRFAAEQESLSVPAIQFYNHQGLR